MQAVDGSEKNTSGGWAMDFSNSGESLATPEENARAACIGPYKAECEANAVEESESECVDPDNSDCEPCEEYDMNCWWNLMASWDLGLAQTEAVAMDENDDGELSVYVDDDADCDTSDDDCWWYQIMGQAQTSRAI